MKRILTMALLFSMVFPLLFSGCGNAENDPSDPNPDEPEKKITEIHFTWLAQGGNTEFVRPGDEVTPVATVHYQDGTEETLPPEALSLALPEGDSRSHIENHRLILSPEVLNSTRISLTLTYLEYEDTLELIVKKDPGDFLMEGLVTDYEALDSMVNKERALPADYVPSDLVKLDVPTVLPNPEINQLRQVASEALTALFEEAQEEGYALKARSGYRSYNTQDGLYRSNVEKNGQAYADKYSAKPGHSEHQTGLAMDITSSSVNNQLSASFGTTPEGIWVAENAHRFGFIIRYPQGKESITGYNYEPWHLRYVGPDLASDIYHSHLTMEEFFYSNRLQP